MAEPFSRDPTGSALIVAIRTRSPAGRG